MTRLPIDRPLRLVTFDLYDTLVEADPPRWQRYAWAAERRGLGGSVEAFARADREAEDFYTIENGRQPIRDRTPDEVRAFRIAYTARYLDLVGLPHDEAIARRIRDDVERQVADLGWNYRVFDDVEPSLAALTDAGVKRAVISNADRDVTEFCLHMGFAQEMDLIVTSALVGWEKPDPRTFHAALDPLGIVPEDALHVGDQALSDISGSRAIGMHAAIIDRYDRHRDDEHPAVRVRSLTELADRVIAHNAAFARR